jgi:hypothetical protein
MKRKPKRQPKAKRIATRGDLKHVAQLLNGSGFVLTNIQFSKNKRRAVFRFEKTDK